ncbi:MAG: hypothetical protein KDA52_14565, partial [Planctomycetaceae bacterium]|nr:hypothetical protein [Planctomycetaceae bacterium]
MRNWNCVVLMAFCLISRTNLTAEETADGPSSGVVKGRVIYLQDKERPWRYQRYYVKTPKSGELAEAVVALRGQGLRDVP